METSPIDTPAEATPETVQTMLDQFNALDAVVDKSSDLYPQYRERQRKAIEIFRRMNLMFGIGHGQSNMNFAAFQKDAEELQRLYEENISIRAGMVYERLKKNYGIDRATDMESSLHGQLDAAFKDPVVSNPSAIQTPLENQEDIRGRLQEICTEMSQNPVNLLTEGTIGYYMIDGKGAIIPHFQKLDKDLAYLDDAEKTLTAWAESMNTSDIPIIQFVRKLKSGLEQIRNIDPQSKELYQWQKQFNVKHDWKPLRILLALTGGLFSVMGLGLAAAGKGFSPATGFWMAVAIGAARPDLLQGGDKAALESIKALDHKKIHYFLTEKDIQGKDGVQAFQDIQLAAESGNAELFHALKDAPNVYKHQIDELLGTDKGKTSELLKNSRMSDADRAQAIQLFGREYDDGQKEMIETALQWGEYGVAKAGRAGTP
ncbi:MAG: hypothetical protein PHZ00_02625 [Candidatus Peribacteraceae bacterium]|nr:hypothetical protein [Candidatus Peribacteraceae bacterium]